MKVFISWSGNESKQIAGILRNWLPSVIQAVRPFHSDDDLAKGIIWNLEILKQLEESRIGLICVTRENYDAPWILFEAGALAKHFGGSRVCPILFGLDPSDVKGPLVQFQAAKFEKRDIMRIVEMINHELGDGAIEKTVLDSVFEMWWPQLEAAIQETTARKASLPQKIKRPDRELLEEMLELLRRQGRTATAAMRQPVYLPELPEANLLEFPSDMEVVDATLGGPLDPNSHDWINDLKRIKLGHLDGVWYGRWNKREETRWYFGPAVIKSWDNSVIIVAEDLTGLYLIIARSDEGNMLTGRYYKPLGDTTSWPWLGKIVCDNRIDGVWNMGRWDFRRMRQGGASGG